MNRPDPGRRQGASGAQRGSAAGSLASQRASIDYALQRRALLNDLRTGRRSLAEACDAHPYLRMAAQRYGELIGTDCPVCSRRSLRHVHYVYGDALGTTSGQAKSYRELERMQERFDEFAVYVVEICQDCGWNLLIRSFVLGGPGAQAPLPSAADG